MDIWYYLGEKWSVSFFSLLIAIILDLIIGDPNNIPHPVIYMGKSISFLENYFRKLCIQKNNSLDKQHRSQIIEKNTQILKVYGGYLVILVIILWMVFPLGILWGIQNIDKKIQILIQGVLMSQLIAKKGLYTESIKVYYALKREDLEEARYEVSMIVGRDTKNLDKKGIIKASVETVAENFSDGVIAPVLAMMIFGLVGGYIYKAINTMDSMIGYKDIKYKDIGLVAAKLDDIVNFIPARLSAVLLILATVFWSLCEYKSFKQSFFNFKESYRIFCRDRFCHASPNSAQTESVCAGALGVKLSGDAYYFGKLYPKLSIGDERREIEVEDIKRVNHLSMWAYGMIIGGMLIMLYYF